MIEFLRRWLAPPIVLGPAGPGDAAAIARLHAESFHRGWSEDEVERLILERNVLVHRAMRGRRLAGFIMSRFAVDEAEILSVAVARAQRGGGLGAKLLRLHLGRLAALGVAKVFLEVDQDNGPALSLYRRAGFHEVGRREGYYQKDGSASSALVLRRDIA